MSDKMAEVFDLTSMHRELKDMISIENTMAEDLFEHAFNDEDAELDDQQMYARFYDESENRCDRMERLGRSVRALLAVHGIICVTNDADTDE